MDACAADLRLSAVGTALSPRGDLELGGATVGIGLLKAREHRAQSFLLVFLLAWKVSRLCVFG